MKWPGVRTALVTIAMAWVAPLLAACSGDTAPGPIDNPSDAMAAPDRNDVASNPPDTTSSDLSVTTDVVDAVADARRSDGVSDATGETGSCPSARNACETCAFAQCCQEYTACSNDAPCQQGLRTFASCYADASPNGTACLDALARISKLAENYAGCLVDACDMPCGIDH